MNETDRDNENSFFSKKNSNSVAVASSTPTRGYKGKLTDDKYGAACLIYYSKLPLTTRDALLMRGFCDKDSRNKSLQRRLLRQVARWRKDLSKPEVLPLDSISTGTRSRGTPISEITLFSPGTETTGTTTIDELQSVATSISRSTASSATTKTKRTRRTVRQKNAEDARKQEQKAQEDKAFVAAAVMYRNELKKPKKERKSARACAEYHNQLHGTHISERTLRRRVQSNTDAFAPRNGRKTVIPPLVEKYLKDALLSFIKLTCVGKQFKPNKKDLCQRLELCLENSPWVLASAASLLERLLTILSPDIQAATAKSSMESRRVNWSTFSYIDAWFDTLKEFLLENKFAAEANENEEGELSFEEAQLHRILNIDETEVSIDGTTSLRGGRPVTEYHARQSKLGEGLTKTNKSGYSATFIGGSTLSGYPVPPHFQLKSDAKDENKKISLGFLENVPSVQGYYGFGKLTRRGVTFNSNAKAGMDTEEFEKYVKNSIVPLYPDAEDVAGKRVLIIVDSGPGRGNKSLLAFLRARGFYVIAGVPNTTHITQATDKNYGLFKTIYRTNLSALTLARTREKKTVRPTDIPLLVFGGNEGNLCLRSAFSEAFAVQKSVAVWKDIGVNPFTRKCLEDPFVVHELLYSADGTIDLASDPVQVEILESVKSNKNAVLNLQKAGCNGTQFKQSVPKSCGKDQVAVTAVNTRERQDAISKAKSAGERFIATGGQALNSDDFFIARERERQNERITVLEERKRHSRHIELIEKEATTLLEQIESNTGEDPYTEVGAKRMKKDQLAKLYEWKKGKKPQQMNKGALLTAWMESKDKPPAHYNTSKWDESNEEELLGLQTNEIEIQHTMVGMERQQLLRQSLAAISAMSKEEVNTELDSVNRERLKEVLEG